MLGDGEREIISYYLGRTTANAAFWAKAEEYGLVKTCHAIRKAEQENRKTIQHITNLIGNVVKEGNSYKYRYGVNKNDL